MIANNEQYYEVRRQAAVIQGELDVTPPERDVVRYKQLLEEAETLARDLEEYETIKAWHRDLEDNPPVSLVRGRSRPWLSPEAETRVREKLGGRNANSD